MAKVTKSKPALQKTATRTTAEKKTVAVEEPMGRYINPLTDFGFKFIFGKKEFLIDFLNTVLKIKGGIVDLHYDNTERPGRSEKDRTTHFDLYCKLKTGEHILIEMQHHRHANFVERTLYYSSRMIQEQGEDKKGDKDWDWNLKAVYSVNIVNFNLDESEKKCKNNGKFISYAHLKDDDNKIISDKLNFVYLELPYFTKNENELTNYIDWWTFVIKNLAQLDYLPNTLRNGIFEKLFFEAEIAKLSKGKRREYNQSLKKLNDMNLIIRDRDRQIEALQKQLAEYHRMYGSLDGTTLSKKPAPRSKVKSRNSAKARATAV